MLTNSLSFKRVSHLFAVIAVTASLAACGGGGGGGDATTPTANLDQQPGTTPTNGNAGAGTPVAPQLLAQYQGTWNSGCIVETAGAASVPVGSSNDSLTFGAPSPAGVAEATSSQRFYASLDCSGAPVAVITDVATLLSG